VHEATKVDPGSELSRELLEFLVELSIGVHRYAMYPARHPSLEPAAESVCARVARLLDDRDSLSIGVAYRQLVVDGATSSPKHPVLSDLARRLHDHHVGALQLRRGLPPAEAGKLLATLATDPGGSEGPVGLRPRHEIPGWEHATLRPLGLDALELDDRDDGEAGEGDPVGELWLGLARAALAREELDGEVPEEGELARAIGDKAADDAYDQVVAGYLRRLTRELKGRRGAEAEEVRRRVSSLIEQLDPETLARLVRLGISSDPGRTFLLDASQVLTVPSVMKILRAAADTSGQTISHAMTRLLSKLARHADHDAGRLRREADTALRDHVERLLDGWELADPNPDAYTGVLDAMARAAPVLGEGARTDDGPAPAERILRTALEVDAWGSSVEGALEETLATEEGTRGVLDLLRQAPEGSTVAEEIRARLTDPGAFRELLAGNRVDEVGLRALVDRMGEAAVDPLLDVLATTDHRVVRRKVFQALVELGPPAGQRAAERLRGPDQRWFVLRNTMAFLLRMETLPEEFDPHPFLEHEDLRVRREALPLAFRMPGRRERALVTALSDEDERMVRMGLLELEGGVPEAVLPTLVNRVALSRDRSAEIRSLAVRRLAGVRATLARNALLELALSERSLFGKARLGSAPEAVAALRVLAAEWADDPDVRPVLAEAARSREVGIRNAVVEAER
jgi:hypothetical protein